MIRDIFPLREISHQITHESDEKSQRGHREPQAPLPNRRELFSRQNPLDSPKPNPVMKPFIPFALLAAIFASGTAGAATTTPVGYVTKALAPNQFTLVGLTVHGPTLASGILDAESATSVTDNQVNFGTLLTAGTVYVLELSDGTIQEIRNWTGSVLTTPEDISGFVTPGTTTYKIRKAATVSDVFGASNTFGLSPDTDGSGAGADIILIPNASNAFDSIVYFNDGSSTGWFNLQGGEADNQLLPYADGFFVQRVPGGSPINLVVSGEVKTAKTGGVLISGYNYLNAVAPVGLTLGDSGLEDFLAVDETGDPATADAVLIQKPDGTYRTITFFDDGTSSGWYDDQSNLADDAALDGGFLIFNRTGLKPFTIAVPESYSTL